MFMDYTNAVGYFIYVTPSILDHVFYLYVAGTANENKTVAEDSETLPDQTKPEVSPQAVVEPAAPPAEGNTTPALAAVEGAPDTAALSPTPAPVAGVSGETGPSTEATEIGRAHV